MDKIFRKKLSFGLFAIAIIFVLGTMDNSWADKVECTVHFDKNLVTFGNYLGWDTVEMDGMDADYEIGKPLLPEKIGYVILEPGSEAIEITVEAPNIIPLRNDLLILPTQEALSKDKRIQPTEPLFMDKITYSSKSFFPSKQAEIIGHGDLAGQYFAIVKVTPFRYVPGTGELYFTPEVRLILETDKVFDKAIFKEPIPAFSSKTAKSYLKRISSESFNPEALKQIPVDSPGSPLLPDVNVEEVIITIDSWVSNFQPLADWRTRCGIPTQIVTKEWITSVYSGSTTEAKIRNFVIDAYDNWGTAYVLIGGDSGTIGSPSKNVDGVNEYSDFYYSDFDEDWIAEVAVGRASVDNSSQADLFVNKVLYYEQTPTVSGGYPNNVFFFAFDLDANTKSEICKNYIDNNYIPGRMKPIATEYDSEAGRHKTDSINYLNSGYNLVNHDDHANATSIGVGSYHHGDYLYNSNMSSLSNQGKLSIFYTMGCHANDFKRNECIGEAFMRNDGGGGIAYMGNTNNGIYIPGSYSTLSYMYDKAFFKSLFLEDIYHLGMTLLDSKNDHYPSSGTYRQVWWEICLLGEPAMSIWTNIPSNATVTAPVRINPGHHDMLISVERNGESSVNATVKISDDSELYESTDTNDSGVALLSFDAESYGDLDFAVSAHDCYLYETNITVADGPGLALSINPGSTTIQRGGTLDVSVEVYNSSGNMLSFDYAADLTMMPSGEIYSDNPLVSAYSLSVEAGSTVSGVTSHPIPLQAPVGTYLYTCRIGNFPDEIWDEVSFEFEITE